MTTENNEVRIIGIKPAHDSDDIPITQPDCDNLLAVGFMQASQDGGTTWKEVICDATGRLLITWA